MSKYRPCVNKKCKYSKERLCDDINGCNLYIPKEPKSEKRKVLRVLNLIAIILTGLLSAVFLFMYFALKFHSMYLFNCLLCNQGLIMLVVLRGIK